MNKDYRICRVEDDEPLIDLGSMLRSVFGGSPQPQPAHCAQNACVRFAALLDKAIVGTVTLSKPHGAGKAARLQSLDVEAEHQTLGCREALLGVALQWAGASEYDALEVAVPATTGQLVDFYLAHGFHIVGSTHDANSGRAIALSRRLAELQPSDEVWYSKHLGAWFAAVAPH